jgi:hypothetical protein
MESICLCLLWNLFCSFMLRREKTDKRTNKINEPADTHPQHTLAKHIGHRLERIHTFATYSICNIERMNMITIVAEREKFVHWVDLLFLHHSSNRPLILELILSVLTEEIWFWLVYWIFIWKMWSVWKKCIFIQSGQFLTSTLIISNYSHSVAS